MDAHSLPVWLINLDRATERRRQMEERLGLLGLNYTRFDAIDGRRDWERLSSSVDISAFRRNVGRDVIPGEIGASHSHLEVWRQLIASEFEIGLVLEDDVVFHKDFIDAINAALTVKQSWDFLKLNKIRAKQPICQGQVAGWRLNAYLGPATGLGAYLIRRDLAERLVSSCLPIRRPIDRELDRLHVHRFRHLGLEPFPSHVDDGNISTITGVGYDQVERFSWYRRLPRYLDGIATLVGKAVWLTASGQIIRWRKPRIPPG